MEVWELDNCLKRKLIAVCPEQQKLKVNMHNSIPLLIRESDLMAKMSLPIPIVALTLYSKEDYFATIQDSLQVVFKYPTIQSFVKYFSVSYQ